MPAIVPAIGAVAGIFGTTAGGLIARIAIGVGLSFLSSALAPKPKVGATTNSPTGSTSDIQFGAEVPRTIPFGAVKDAGHFIYFNSYGTTNKFLQLVYVLGDWRLEGPTTIIIDGKSFALIEIAATGSETKRYRVNTFATNIIIKFYDGNPSQAVDSELVNNANPAGRWSANNTLAGMSYLSITLTYDPKLFDNIPSFEWIFQGAKLYDWRQDSTNGGSGTHRWATPSTWEYSANPAVIRYNYQKGFFINGQRVLGMALTDADLLLSLYTTAANICDEIITNPDASTQKRYQCCLVVRDDQRYGDVLRAIDLCMAGMSVERQGAFAPIAGAGYTPADTFVDADIVAEEAFEFQAKRTREELLNAVFGQFVNPAAHWEMDSYPPIISTALETTDGERLSSEGMDFPGVINHWRAQRLARIALNLTRLQAKLSCVLGAHKIFYQVGDWVTYSSGTALYSRTYRVEGKKVDPITKRIYLALQEISATAYADDILTDIAPTITDPNATRATTVASFTIQATTITAVGRTLPALKFNWTPPDDATIDAVIIEYRKVGTLVSFTARHNTPEDGQLVTAANVVGGTNYEARATITTSPARDTTFTGWVSIPTSAEVVDGSILDTQSRHALDLVLNDIPGSITALNRDTNQVIQNLAGTVTQETNDRILATNNVRDTINLRVDAIDGPTGSVITERDLRIGTDNYIQGTFIQGVITNVKGYSDTVVASEAFVRNQQDNLLAQRVDVVTSSLTTKTNVYLQDVEPTHTFAAGTLTASANFLNGESINIGGRVYTLQTTLTNVDGNVHLGANLTATLLNLLHGINRSGGVVGTDYATAMVAHPTVDAIASDTTTLSVRAKLATSAGNAIVTSTTSPTAAWSGGKLSGALNNGDLWITNAGVQKVWNGSAFVPVAAATSVQVFKQATTPAGNPPVNSLWFNTTPGQDINLLKIWDGTTWNDARDGLTSKNTADIGNETSARVNSDGALASTMSNVSAQFNGLSANGFIRMRASAGTPGARNGNPAVGTLTATGNVANADTVTIDGRIYTFQTTLTNANGNVKIGASAQASLLNLANAINGFGGTPGTDYALSTVAHQTVSASSGATTLTATARAPGGGGIPVSETAANLSWSGATLVSADVPGTLPAGIAAQYEIQLNVGTVGAPNFATTGIYVQVTTGGVSRMFFDAAQIYMGNHASSVDQISPFALVGSELRLQNVKVTGGLSALNADMGTLTSGKIIGGLIKSANNKLVIDLDHDRITFNE